MKDTELRAIILQKYYDLRERGSVQLIEIEEDKNFPIKDRQEIGRICGQLAENKLIEWSPTKMRGFIVGGIGKITASGVDVIERTAEAPVSITFDHRQTVNISGSNNIVGDHNAQNISKMDFAISHSNFSEAEKAEAKSLWQKVCANKLLSTVIGSVFGAAAKHALESATHSK